MRKRASAIEDTVSRPQLSGLGGPQSAKGRNGKESFADNGRFSDRKFAGGGFFIILSGANSYMVMKEDFETGGSSDAQDETAQARRDMIYGLLWCVGGLAFSFISYYFTEAGGRYTIATGAIVWGAFQALRGFTNRLRQLRRMDDTAGFKRMLLIGLAAVLLVGGLSLMAYGLTHAPEDEYLAEEQIYDSPQLKLHVVIPEGFSEYESEMEPETDSTYAFAWMSAYNDDTAIRIDGIVDRLRPDSVSTVEEISDYLNEMAAEFMTGGLLRDAEPVEIGGQRMLKYIGRSDENPDMICNLYEAVHDCSVISIYYAYRATRIDPERDLAADRFAAGAALY